MSLIDAGLSFQDVDVMDGFFVKCSIAPTISLLERGRILPDKTERI